MGSQSGCAQHSSGPQLHALPVDDSGSHGPQESLNEASQDPPTTSGSAFHCCPPRAFQEALLDSEAASKNLRGGHIVLCIFADEKSPRIGIRNFLLSLRSSTLNYETLKDVVILGSSQYIQKEWRTIQDFPKVWVHDVSAKKV